MRKALLDQATAPSRPVSVSSGAQSLHLESLQIRKEGITSLQCMGSYCECWHLEVRLVWSVSQKSSKQNIIHISTKANCLIYPFLLPTFSLHSFDMLGIPVLKPRGGKYTFCTQIIPVLTPSYASTMHFVGER